MASSGLTGFSIPRFLLPRLTWQTPIASPPAAAALLYRRSKRGITSQRQSNDIRFSNTQIHPFQPSSHTGPTAKSSPSTKPSTSTSAAAKRAFSSTAHTPRDHHFDTLKFVQRLKDEGFSEEQAVSLMKILSDVVEERYDKLIELRPSCIPHSV